LTREDFIEISIVSAKQVGRPIFFAVAIMVVSFLPVFLLEDRRENYFARLRSPRLLFWAGPPSSPSRWFRAHGHADEGKISARRGESAHTLSFIGFTNRSFAGF